MQENLMKKLYATFPLKVREGQGGMKFKYVPNEDVVNRMNQVFSGNWSTEVKDKDVVDDQVIVEVEVSVVDPETQMTFKHTGFGSQQIMRYSAGKNAGQIIDIGNAYKSALSKGIVNACTRWGVGLFKEKNAYNTAAITPVEEGDVDLDEPQLVNAMPSPPETAAQQNGPIPPPPKWTPVESTGAPVAPPIPTTDGSATITPPNTGTTPPLNTTPPSATDSVPPQTGAVGDLSPPTSIQSGMPTGAPVSNSLTITQETESPQGPVPNFPTPNTGSNPVPPPATPPPAQNFAAGEGNLGGISDVQRVALNGILSMQKVAYEDLAQQAFADQNIDKPIPPKENLSYEEAVIIIKYGNDKFRKK